jgi:hypothetical protein
MCRLDPARPARHDDGGELTVAGGWPSARSAASRARPQRIGCSALTRLLARCPDVTGRSELRLQAPGPGSSAHASGSARHGSGRSGRRDGGGAAAGEKRRARACCPGRQSLAWPWRGASCAEVEACGGRGRAGERPVPNPPSGTAAAGARGVCSTYSPPARGSLARGTRGAVGAMRREGWELGTVESRSHPPAARRRDMGCVRRGLPEPPRPARRCTVYPARPAAICRLGCLGAILPTWWEGHMSLVRAY